MGALLFKPLRDAIIPKKTSVAPPVAALKGVTNAEAQAKSNAESRARARARLSLANKPKGSLLTESLLT